MFSKFESSNLDANTLVEDNSSIYPIDIGEHRVFIENEQEARFIQESVINILTVGRLMGNHINSGFNTTTSCFILEERNYVNM